jgi:hypothetical protein
LREREKKILVKLKKYDKLLTQSIEVLACKENQQMEMLHKKDNEKHHLARQIN